MRKWLLTALLLPALSQAAPLDELLSRLNHLQTLSGQFEQTVMDQGETRLQEASGEMQVARGNRFYWFTELPFEQLAVSDGDTVWVHDIDLEQVVVRPLANDLGRTPALLFGGNPEQVAGAFAVEELSRLDQQVTYRLRPKGSDPLFEELDVSFEGEVPVSMRLSDALGQKTVIDFINPQVNQPIDQDKFNFVPPADADVIQQQP